MNIKDTLMKNRNNLFKYGRDFQRVFHVSLHSFWDPVFGFDIVRFDDFIKTPDGVSTSDFIVEKYGKSTHEMIEALL